MSIGQESGHMPEKYTSGTDRYVNFVEDFLDIRPSQEQKRVLRSVVENQRTLLWGANGPGKSFITAALKLAFLLTNPDSKVIGTSGSYSQYHDTMWKPLTSMHDHAKEEYGIPGNVKGGRSTPILTLDDEWFAKVVSPRNPGELEGRHGSDVLVVLDEADKPQVTEEHFDSAGSSITDLNDRMIAVCNPPEDENNVVYRKKKSARWNVVEISAFDSHNVQVDAGIVDDEPIPGVVDLITIASDWEAWTGRDWFYAEEHSPFDDWIGMPEVQKKLDKGEVSRDEVVSWLAPGYEKASRIHEERGDLPKNWYIRRAGVIPPQAASALRPIEQADVEAAWNRYRNGSLSQETKVPRTVGVDVARSGDQTVVAAEHNSVLRVHYSEQGTDHERQKKDVVEGTTTFDGLRNMGNPDIAVDKGYAPGFFDHLNAHLPRVEPFQNGTVPHDPERWYDKWAEALHHFGKWLEEGGVITDEDLWEQAMAASRVIEFESRSLQSRGENGEEVYKATSKEALKDELGHSPDEFDAALMAIWRLRSDSISQTSSTWYDPYA